MNYHLSFCRYQRAFVKPLRTAHGVWSLREGFIVRMESDCGIGYGEVAPIPEFGTETVEEAAAFLESTAGTINFSPDNLELEALPCCAFGLSAARRAAPTAPQREYSVAALLPAGRAALKTVGDKIERNYRHFKWKIGVEPVSDELAILAELSERLPDGSQLRLDANGGFSTRDLEDWLSALQAFSGSIEYLEQPLPVGQEAQMAAYAVASGIPIALDESLHDVEGRRWLKVGAWQGPLVIKPALMGDCSLLVEHLQPLAAQVVLSSVFETAIGLENALRVADQLPDVKHPIGFDTPGVFADDLNQFQAISSTLSANKNLWVLEAIWKQIVE